MDVAKAKEYLKSLHALEIKIEQRNIQIEELRLKAMGVGSPGIDPNKVQVSTKGDKMSNAVGDIVDMQRETEELIVMLEKKRDEIISRIHRLTEPKYIAILFKKYVEKKPHRIIADEVGYAQQYERALLAEALREFARKNQDIK